MAMKEFEDKYVEWKKDFVMLERNYNSNQHRIWFTTFLITRLCGHDLKLETMSHT